MHIGFGLLILGLFALYAALFLAGVIYFRTSGNGPFKSQWYTRYVIFMACAFFFFFFLPLPDAGLPGLPAQSSSKHEAASLDRNEVALALFFMPLIAFKAWRNIRTTRFCPKCGTMHRRKIFNTFKFCRRCGTELPVR